MPFITPTGGYSPTPYQREGLYPAYRPRTARARTDPRPTSRPRPTSSPWPSSSSSRSSKSSTVLAPGAKPGSPAADRVFTQRAGVPRYVSGGSRRPAWQPGSGIRRSRPDPSAKTESGGFRYTRDASGAFVLQDEFQAIMQNQFADAEDPIYYGPGGTLQYGPNFRAPQMQGGLIIGLMQPAPGKTSTALYKEGSENGSIFWQEGWDDRRVREFRAKAMELREYYPEIFTKPLGIQGMADWGREGDLQAMRWFMGYANSKGMTVEEAQMDLLVKADNGQLLTAEEQGLVQGINGGGGGGGGTSGGGATQIERLTRQVQKTVSLSTFDRARALLGEQLEGQLGRRPYDSEVKQFLSALNALERANPTVTTNEYEYADEFTTDPELITTTTVPGEIDYGSEAREAALEGNEEEAREFGLGSVRDVISSKVGL